MKTKTLWGYTQVSYLLIVTFQFIMQLFKNKLKWKKYDFTILIIYCRKRDKIIAVNGKRIDDLSADQLPREFESCLVSESGYSCMKFTMVTYI